MARILSSYGAHLEAEEAIIEKCREYLWARLKCGSNDVDLLFKAGCTPLLREKQQATG
jgi:hypothetical protein